MVTETAEEIGAATPLRNLAQAQYHTALEHGLGERDFSAVYRVVTVLHHPILIRLVAPDPSR